MLADLFKKPNDVFYMADHHVEFQGDVDLKRFSRLMDIVDETIEVAPLFVVMQAGKNQEAGMFVDIKVKGVVPMLCQRCLQPIDHAINFRRLFGLVSDEMFADRLPQEYEPLLVGEDDEEAISIINLIEDEVLLECPMVVYHKNKGCNQYLNEIKKENTLIEGFSEDQAPEIKKKNPFAVLKDMKIDKN